MIKGGVFVMKKFGLLICCSLFLIALTACGKSGDEDTASSTKSKTIEASIEDASYILSGKNDGESIDEDAEGGLLKIDMQIKNVSDSSVDVYPDMHMQLYDGDNQIDPSKASNPSFGLSVDTNNTIGADKQKTVSVVFDVEKDKEYEINIDPMPQDVEQETEEVKVPLDTSEYSDSLEALQDPGKALTAYVETIYFDKDTTDYDTYVSADKNGIQEDAIDQFSENLESSLNYTDMSDKDAEKYYESFKEAAAEKNEIETEVLTHINDKALVKLKYTALSNEDITKGLRDYKEKYAKKNSDYNPEKGEEYALSKFDSIIDKMESKKGKRELEVYMKQEDGKWMIDDSEYEMSNRLMTVFAEGVVM